MPSTLPRIQPRSRGEINRSQFFVSPKSNRTELIAILCRLDQSAVGPIVPARINRLEFRGQYIYLAVSETALISR